MKKKTPVDSHTRGRVTKAKPKSTSAAKARKPPNPKVKPAVAAKTRKKKANEAAPTDGPAPVTGTPGQNTAANSSLPQVPSSDAVPPKSKFQMVVEHFGLTPSVSTKSGVAASASKIMALQFLAHKGEGQKLPLLSTLPGKAEVPDYVQWFFNASESWWPKHDYEADGPQKWILDTLRGARKVAVLKRFEEAKRTSSMNCVLLTGDRLYGKGWLRKTDFEMADSALLRAIELNFEANARIPDGRGRLRDPDFLRKLRAEMRRWDERKRDPRAHHEELFCIAYHWTSPVCPLWMMTAAAAVDAVNVKLNEVRAVQNRSGELLNVDRYFKIIERAGLPKFSGSCPIFRTVLERTSDSVRPDKFKAYEWSRWAEKLLKL